MTTQAQETSIRTQIVVAAPSERAFRVFTEDFDKVKPREHNMLDVEIVDTVFEPRAVEVRFISETPERTRVELEHRNLDAHGEGWEGERDAIGGEGGWPLYLQRFGALLKAPT